MAGVEEDVLGRVVGDLKKMKEAAMGYLERQTARQRDQNEQRPRGGTMTACPMLEARGRRVVVSQAGHLSQVLEWSWADLWATPFPSPGDNTVEPGAPGHSGVSGGGVETAPGLSHHDGAEPAKNAGGRAGCRGPAEAGEHLRGAGPGGRDPAAGKVSPPLPQGARWGR